MNKKQKLLNCKQMSREISQGTKEYANNLLDSTEKVLTDTLAKFRKKSWRGC